MPIKEVTPIGRLAYRVEGEFWNAYFASMDTMVDAQLLASIRMSLVQDEDHKAAFKKLMWACFCDIVESITGGRPIRGEEQSAPEHDRTKE